MKKVNELNIKDLRIPAYAVVDMKSGVSREVHNNREDARKSLQSYKQIFESNDFKIVKLQAQKVVR